MDECAWLGVCSPWGSLAAVLGAIWTRGRSEAWVETLCCVIITWGFSRFWYKDSTLLYVYVSCYGVMEGSQARLMVYTFICRFDDPIPSMNNISKLVLVEFGSRWLMFLWKLVSLRIEESTFMEMYMNKVKDIMEQLEAMGVIIPQEKTTSPRMYELPLRSVCLITITNQNGLSSEGAWTTMLSPMHNPLVISSPHVPVSAFHLHKKVGEFEMEVLD